MTLAVFDPWIALAKQWQPLMAGLLVVFASIILAGGIIRAAKINAVQSSGAAEKPNPNDMGTEMAAVDGGTIDSVNVNLDKLRSLLRSALSALSSTDANDETARSLCARIAAFPWTQFPVLADADKRIRDADEDLLKQFEMLRAVVGEQWSPSEASAILIQLNAHARTLAAILGEMESARTRIRGHQNSR